MKKSITRNPWLIFSPFLLYYGYLVIKNKWPSLYGDEIRYMDFAKNLTHGYYSPFPAHINLWNGPGYPIILMPFAAFHIPDIYTTLMNAVFEYLSVVFLYKALNRVTNHKTALWAGLLLALYPNALSMLPILYTEAFSMFLVSLLVYFATLSYFKTQNKYIILTGLVFGYLTLTKIIFGYVIIVGLLGCLTMMLFREQRYYYLKTAKIMAVAFLITIPYLCYTYYITGKPFYWGNSGGMSLYWMSTPYEHEYGDWKLPDLSNKQYPTMYPSAEVVTILKKNHAKELKSILNNDEVKQDDLFKQQAMANIKKNPVKFIQNYFYNWARMLFNFPYSYAYQDAGILENVLIGSITLWLSLIGMVVTWRNWRAIVFPVKITLFITAIYLILSGALSAYPRQLNIVIPVILFWLGYLVTNMRKTNLSFGDAISLDDIELTELKDIGIITGQSK